MFKILILIFAKCATFCLKESWHQQNKYTTNSSSRTDNLSESQLTIISTIISVVFIICHGVRWIPNIYELVQISHPAYTEDAFVWPLWVENVSIISHFLITLNSSINFYIYYASRIKEVGVCLSPNCLSKMASHDQEFDPSTNISRFWLFGKLGKKEAAKGFIIMIGS